MNKDKVIQVILIIVVLAIIGAMVYMIYSFVNSNNSIVENYNASSNNYYENINTNNENSSNLYNHDFTNNNNNNNNNTIDGQSTEIVKSESESNEEMKKTDKIKLTINNTELTATLSNNSSAESFAKKLQESPITINMSDYSNFEKVGSLGFSLPRNDENITTSYGDIILYQGNQITIYYGTNSWSFTRLAKIDNVSQNELKKILGNGDVTVTFSIN